MNFQLIKVIKKSWEKKIWPKISKDLSQNQDQSLLEDQAENKIINFKLLKHHKMEI